MEIIGFVGESGTGKSYRASLVARENHTEYIIDDGLFIKDNSILAGRSAKREKTKIASVRRALFTDPEHARQVREAIRKSGAQSILILGTSDDMVRAIAQALSLPAPSRIINIRDVATEDEIKEARHIRVSEGKHVIPVPTFEVKKQFSGYFLDSLRFFTRDKRDHTTLMDKSIVRPAFSYLGKYTISDRVIVQLCQFEAGKVQAIYKVPKVYVNISSRGVVIEIDVVLRFGFNFKQATDELIRLVTNAVEELTAVNVIQVLVNIRSLYIKPDKGEQNK